MSNLLKDNKELMKEYNFEKNIDIDLDSLTNGTGKKIWWKCNKSHEWEASIDNRNRGTGCPYCSGRKAIIGYNDLATINPSLAKEWNYERNGDLKPNMVKANTNKIVWWKCNKGHEWKANIGNRNLGKNCPICSNHQVLQGYNDLATINPSIVKEWNYERNGDLKPTMVVSNNSKKVWWKCDKGHEWEATIVNRNRGTSCPYCMNNQILKNYNDLNTINPKLAKEWNYEKNGDLKPDMVMPNSNKKVWWRCNKGHEWEADICSRNVGANCPYCAKELQTSFPEQAIYFYIKKIFPDAISGDRHLKMELDIFIPSEKIAIEYDGAFWHRNPAKDERKNELCKKHKILLFRVKENLQEKIEESEYLKIVPCAYNDVGIKNAIEYILKKLNKNIDVDLDRDRALIYNSFINNQKEQSLLIINPNIAKEWNYEKNGDLKPDMVMANSGKKVWWICNEGHEWQAVIKSRNNGCGCPICSSQQVLKGYNDLTVTNNKVAQEWNYEKNGDLKPDMVMANSDKKVWWKCDKGHEWQAIIKNRNKGIGCPICSNRQVLKGYNDLETVNPKLTKQWNYEKNGDLKPSMLVANSHKKVWWKCDKGHEWESTIINRNRGTGCPICKNKK